MSMECECTIHSYSQLSVSIIIQQTPLTITQSRRRSIFKISINEL